MLNGTGRLIVVEGAGNRDGCMTDDFILIADFAFGEGRMKRNG
jgi:hypothetical protein